jgi:RES domain-containing protein
VCPEWELAGILHSLRLIRVDGPFHRFADLGFVHRQLSAGQGTAILRGLGAKLHGGRFTPRDAFETLYVATSAETARIEAESRITGSGVIDAPARPFVHFLLSGRLQGVLDLSDHSVLRVLETTVEEMAAPWVMRQMQGREAVTQTLGRIAHAALRIEGILFVSSKDRPNGRCLAIFPDRLRKGSALEIADDTGLVKEKLYAVKARLGL